jgi:hypothetical protein
MRFLSQRSGKQFDPQIIEIMSQFSAADLPNDWSAESTGPFEENVVVAPAYADAMFS